MNNKTFLKGSLIGLFILFTTIGIASIPSIDDKGINFDNNSNAYNFSDDYINIPYKGYFRLTSLEEILSGSKIIISRANTNSDNTIDVLSSSYKVEEVSINPTTLTILDDGSLDLSSSSNELILETISNSKGGYYLKLDNGKYLGPQSSSGSNISFKLNSPMYPYYFSISDKINHKVNISCPLIELDNQVTSYPYLSYYSSKFFSQSNISSNLGLYISIESTMDVFVKDYLKMDSFELNQCKSLYPTAKAKLIALGDRYISALENEPNYLSARDRYEAWARANKDTNPYGR